MRNNSSKLVARTRFARFALALVSALPAASASGNELFSYWSGTSSTDWGSRLNWQPDKVPDNTDTTVYHVRFIEALAHRPDAELYAQVAIESLGLEEDYFVLTLVDNAKLQTGDIDNKGEISLAPSTVSHNTTLQVYGDILGGGTISMFGQSASLLGAGGTSWLTNENTIRGAGKIEQMSLDNQGTIISTSAGLTLHIAAKEFDNDQGTLQVNAGCRMEIDSAGSFLSFQKGTLSGSYVVGGELQFYGAATLHTLDGSLTLNGLSASITDSSGAPSLQGFNRITESGSLNIATHTFAFSPIINEFYNAGEMTVGEGGWLQVDHTRVHNTGLIQVEEGGRLTVRNGCTISGDVSSAGTMELSGGVSFRDDSTTVARTFTLLGGGHARVSALNNRIEQVVSIEDGATIDLASDSSLIITDTYKQGMVNDGQITVGARSMLVLNALQPQTGLPEAFELDGAGTITLNNAELKATVDGSHLINNGNTIEGAGTLGGGTMKLTNHGGSIVANQVMPLHVNPNNLGFRNDGELRVEDGSTMIINNANNSFSSLAGEHLQGGSYFVAGTLKIENCRIARNDGQIELSGADSKLIEFNGGDSLANLVAQGAGGALTVSNGRHVALQGLAPGGFRNDGLLSAGDGGSMLISDGTLAMGESGIAAAQGGTLELRNLHVLGGIVEASAGGRVIVNTTPLKTTLLTDPDGTIEVHPSRRVEFAGEMYNDGTIAVSANATLSINTSVGTALNNEGVVAINSARMLINGQVEFAGAGAIELSGAGYIEGEGSGAHTLINGNTIRGSGTIDLMRLSVQNNGVIGADRAGDTLHIQRGAIDNRSEIVAIGGGITRLDAATIVNGTARAATAGEIELMQGQIVSAETIVESGGRLRSLGGTTNTLSGSLDNQLAGSVIVDSQSHLMLGANGDYRNDGQILVADSATLSINGDTTLYGGGELRLAGASSRLVDLASAGMLTNDEDHTIAGGGALGDGRMGLLNRGRIVANNPAAPMVVLPNARNLSNEGTFRVESAATLNALGPIGSFTNYSKTTATLTDGTYDVAGTLRFTDACVVTNESRVILDGPSARIVDQSDSDALRDLCFNAGNGEFSVINGKRLLASGSFNNAGAVFVGDASEIRLPDTKRYTQTAGVTTIDGLLKALEGVFIEDGVLDGDGTIDGPLTIVDGDFNPGHSPARFTVTGHVENKPGATYNMELAGGTLGTSYDNVTVDDSVKFDGQMNVTLLADFKPRLGDMFEVVSHEGFEGSFGTMNLPGLDPGLAWRVDYNPTNLTLVVVPEPVCLSGVAVAAILLRRRRHPR